MRIKVFTIILMMAVGMSAAPNRIHLLFTNDIHGAIHRFTADFMNPEFGPQLTGGAGAFAYVQQVRQAAEQSGDAVLLLDGGNFFQGSPLGARDGGKTIIRWMNTMGYDALTPGLEDFDFGPDNLAAAAHEADFPFLSGNIFTESGNHPPWLNPWLIRDFNGLQVAIVGLSSASLPDQTLPENTAGLEFEADISTARTLVADVRDRGADVVILLAHMGLPYDREEVFEEFLIQIEQGIEIDQEVTKHDAMALAHLVPGVDIIVTGGVSKGYDDPWEDPLTHTLVVQNYGNLTGVGHLIMNIDRQTRRIISYDYPTDRGIMISLLEDDIWPDQQMDEQIRQWAAAAVDYSRPDYSGKINNLPPGDCGPAPVTTVTDEFDVPVYGSPERLEVVTWNLEWFPAAGDTTLRSVAEIVADWQVDIVAFQEIKNVGQFARMMEFLPDHAFVISEMSSFMDQAIVYRKDAVTFLGRREPFAENDYYYAGRPPFMVDFLWRCGDVQREISLINMHLKCCGDGLYRRQRSMERLHGLLTEYLTEGFENIIVVGDWNDDLADVGLEQSFTVFLDDRDYFRFATEEIYRDLDQASYPSWPSFLDHILYARGFFDEQSAGGHVQTLKPEDYVGGWEIYEETLSDHRPVLWSIPVD